MPETLTRRGLLAGGAALLLADAPVPATGVLQFKVVRHGSVIGFHRLDFAGGNGNLRVTVNVEMALFFGPIRIFHYTHHALESWQGGQCESVTSQTNHDGKPFQLRAQRDAAGWLIDGSKGRLRAPPNSLPATHWNRRMLEGPMINTETGSVMRPRIADLGRDTIPKFPSGTLEAEHFRLTGDAQMDTWYDAAPSWAGARFVGGDGSEIVYERV